MKIAIGLLLAGLVLLGAAFGPPAIFLFFVSCRDRDPKGGDRGADGALSRVAATSAPPPDQAEIARDGALRAAGSTGSPLGPHEPPTTSAAPAASLPIASSLHLALLEPAAAPSAVVEVALVTIETPRVRGGLLTNIDPAILRMRAGIRACYARSVEEQDDPPPTSTLLLHVFVMQSGSVRSVVADQVSGLGAAVVDCMVRRAQMATFPPPVGEPAEVIVPITLHPRHP